jgi:pimeloyl-ACP methyl ester carboxylesterase
MDQRHSKLLAGACALLIAAAWSASSAAQSTAPTGLFDAVAEGAHGNIISADQCRPLEQQHTAVWVRVHGKGWCLRYYAFGLERENAVAAAWLHGDIGGSRGSRGGPSGHQQGLGPAAMIEQERRLSAKYHTPFVFLGRPGAYGSGGYHHDIAHTRLEADLVAAEIEDLTVRYGVKSWVLAGHSGGGSLVAEMLDRRRDIACAVVSSGAPDFNAHQAAHHQPKGISPNHFNAVADVAHMPSTPGQRIIVMGDPRDKNVFWSLQQHYADVLKRHGANVTVLPLERGRPPELHSLVDLAETAAGLCAQGVDTAAIGKQLQAMPSQAERVSN